MSIDLLYQVALALYIREVGKTVEEGEAIAKALDNINPVERVEQTRREDGMLEHDPTMEIPGWGLMDDSDMPAMEWGPPANASSGTVDGFDTA